MLSRDTTYTSGLCVTQLLATNTVIDADVFAPWSSLRGNIKEVISVDPDQARSGGGIKAAERWCVKNMSSTPAWLTRHGKIGGPLGPARRRWLDLTVPTLPEQRAVLGSRSLRWLNGSFSSPLRNECRHSVTVKHEVMVSNHSRRGSRRTRAEWCGDWGSFYRESGVPQFLFTFDPVGTVSCTSPTVIHFLPSTPTTAVCIQNTCLLLWRQLRSSMAWGGGILDQWLHWGPEEASEDVSLTLRARAARSEADTYRQESS